ncbi:MAG: Cys-tRNA(Pro) deacylase [Desulfobacteraceae bacterium]|nr:Cys-tRNA(Pro) deacylase [Desulfobacteraceae bacterium]
MTPAINIAKKAKINFHIHEYDHDPASESYGEEAALKLGIDGNRVFKTLVVFSDSEGLSVAVLPVSHQLDLKRMAKALAAKKVTMADKSEVERVTGYVLGGVSPLAQKKKLITVIDDSAKSFDTIFVSAGRRGLEIELSAGDLKSLTNGRFYSIIK